jgi:hypothetical protein
MRVVATEYVSLDGVFEEPGMWSSPWFNDEAGQFKAAELRASDALLLGRKTYEGFAAAWPSMREETGEFGAKFNDMPKYVVSTTLKDPEWSGSQVLEGDPVEAVRALREQRGHDLLLNLSDIKRFSNGVMSSSTTRLPASRGGARGAVEDGLDPSTAGTNGTLVQRGRT